MNFVESAFSSLLACAARARASLFSLPSWPLSSLTAHGRPIRRGPQPRVDASECGVTSSTTLSELALASLGRLRRTRGGSRPVERVTHTSDEHHVGWSRTIHTSTQTNHSLVWLLLIGVGYFGGALIAEWRSGAAITGLRRAASLQARDARDYLDPTIRRTTYSLLAAGVVLLRRLRRGHITDHSHRWLSASPCWHCCFSSSSCPGGLRGG